MRLMPFNFFISIGGTLTNFIASKLKVAPIWLMFFGTVVEPLGVGLLANLPSTGSSPGVVYFYEIMAGIGTGFIWGMVIVIPPFLVQSQEKDIAGGATFQTRAFGGALGLSIASTILNNYLTSHLSGIIESFSSLLANLSVVLSALSLDS